MEGYPRRALLVLSIAVAATALPPPGREAVSYEEAVALGVDVFNQESGEASAFRLLEAKPQPEWDPKSLGNQELDFTVKETVCPTPADRLVLEECDFKDDGMVVDCSAAFVLQEGDPGIQINCDSVEREYIRGRRRGSHKQRSKRKKALKKAIWHIIHCHDTVGGGHKGLAVDAGG